MNSKRFLENGMRRVSRESLNQILSEGFLFNFDTGNGYLIFWDDKKIMIGSFRIKTSLRNKYSEIVGGTFPDDKFTGMGKYVFSETVDFLFSNYPIERIEVNVLKSNQGSIAMTKYVGFQEEGVKRKAWFCNGALHDQVVLGLLREEYESKTQNNIHQNVEHRPKIRMLNT